MSRLPVLAVLTFQLLLAPVLARSADEPASIASATPRAAVTVDPFYDVPTLSPDGQPGDLLRAEPIVAPEGVIAWRILYRSTGLAGAPVVVSGTVFAPDAKPPSDGFPVVAIGHNTTGIAPACGPSLDPFTPLPGADAAFYPEQAEPFVDAGVAVVATDYRGLGAADGVHPYLVGEAAAYDVLDAARAAPHVDGLRLRSETILWGHSQGGHAAAWAGQKAADYAPEIDIVGVALAAPAADPAALIASATRDATAATPLTGFVASLVSTWETVYPRIASPSALTPAGRAKTEVVAQECIPAVAAAYADRPLGDYLDVDIFSSRPWIEPLERNAAGRAPTAAPVLVVQGTADLLVPSAVTETFVQRLCDTGTTVRLDLYPDVGHGAVIAAAMPDILTWVSDRLSGAPANSEC